MKACVQGIPKLVLRHTQVVCKAISNQAISYYDTTKLLPVFKALSSQAIFLSPHFQRVLLETSNFHVILFTQPLFLSTSQHENMETQNTEVKNFGLFGAKDLLGGRQGSWKCKKQDKNNKSVQTKKKVVGRFSVAHKMSLSQQKGRTFVVKLFLFSSLDEGVGVLW